MTNKSDSRCERAISAIVCRLLGWRRIDQQRESSTVIICQKYSNISCLWETQPVGCVRISCAFRHSKPRIINGLFLPPSNNAPLQQGVQGGILHPAHRQESLRNQENLLFPIHPPLIINLNDEDDDEEDDEEEENYVSDWVPKTAADIEEERAIKEICYKSGKYEISHSFLNSSADKRVNVGFFFPLGVRLGEYYRIQYPHQQQSTKTASSPRENELLPLEATERDLQKESSSKEYRLVSIYLPYYVSPSFLTKWRDREKSVFVVLIGLSTKNIFFILSSSLQSPAICHLLSNSTTFLFVFSLLGIHTSDPTVKPGDRQRGRGKDDGTAASIPYVRETGRKTYSNSSGPPRSAYVVYRTVTVSQEPTSNGSTDKYTSGSYNAPTWRKKTPHAKTFARFKTTIQQSQEDVEANRTGERYVDRRKR
ncbi:uncharacterized protein C12orf50 homolog [Aptenodytes patagonicus]|uniref:uncharacterized protein C12orf50 homolog n=1 Tax=Aptenodytes patagonicus TaxID=9234 RepID=UPI003F9F98D2